jgi:predicted transcriptional regulator
MRRLEQYVTRNGLTQARAAQVFGVTQPRVSDLLTGKLSVFSLDELVRMYDSTGSQVRLVFVADKKREKTILKRVMPRTVDQVVAGLPKARGERIKKASRKMARVMVAHSESLTRVRARQR